MPTYRSAATAAASFLLLTGAVIAAAPVASAGTPGGTHANDRNCDFNGDGHEDVLIGAPNAVVGGARGAGLASVQYGGRDGIGTGHARLFSRATPGIEGAAGPHDHFGTAVASGDLDSDGYDDAIIGVPGDDTGHVPNAGSAVILWGSPRGLSGTDSTLLRPTEPVADGHFGGSLAAARLTGATPGDALAVLDRRDVTLFTYRAPAGGLTGTPRPEVSEASAARPGRWDVRRLKVPSLGHRGGHTRTPRSLTTGDYDNDGYADLVVSGTDTATSASDPARTGARGTDARGTDAQRPAPARTDSQPHRAHADPARRNAQPRPAHADPARHGWSAYLPGSADGPAWVRDLPGGPATGSGDVNGDGYDDLVAGTHGHPGGGRFVGGLVAVHFGGPDGPGGPGAQVQYWSQDSAGVPGVGEPGDDWGADVSVGDTDGDGYADVAIGAPGENLGAVADAGTVTVLPGTPGGLVGSGAQTWTQDTADVPGSAEQGDRWGAQVRLVDPDGDRHFDLVAAAPDENGGAGMVWFLPAASGGVTATGSWAYGLGSLDSPGSRASLGAPGSPHAKAPYSHAPYANAAYGAAIDE